VGRNYKFKILKANSKFKKRKKRVEKHEEKLHAVLISTV